MLNDPVRGPDGPWYADFHSLRHTFIALLGRSGATLKEAMQLARHSDPKLTMAVYGRAQLSNLGTAVARLPSVFAGSPDALPDAQTGDAGGGVVTGAEAGCVPGTGNGVGLNSFDSQGVEAECGSVISGEGSSPSRTRTYNKPVNSRLLYH